MPRGMIAADLYRIQWLSDANLSPDGRTAAFTATWLDAEDDDYHSAIWTVATNGNSAPARFTCSGGKDNSPRWSPDGTKLAFLSNRSGGKPQLLVIDVNGGEARELTSLIEGAGPPVWSPDNRRLVFVARVPDEPPNIEVEKPKNPPARVISTLKYRGNGEGFTYDRRRHIFVVDAETERVQQITDGDWDDVQPAWSPDSESIAFVSARHEDRDYDRAADIFVVGASGGTPLRLTQGAGSVALPAWSPDGGKIAYLGYADAEDAPRNSRLWLLPADGNAAPRCLTGAYDRQLEISETCPPVWSSDGNSILTGFEDRGATGVIAIDAAGGAVAERLNGKRSITGFSVSRSGEVAFAASTGSSPAEVFFDDGRGERQLTDLNAPWRAEVKLETPEHFCSTSDGCEIDAWLLRPAGFVEGRTYPTLVNVHGGPFGQYGWAFLDEFQVESGAGYAVLYCNPRGSSGRDDEFARAIIGAPGEPDTADIMAAVDAALMRYDFIDASRLGVLGGSYGGYLTSWIIGHTNRFAAACSERALNNRYSKEGTSDIWSGYTYLRTRQWQEPELYARFSPISYVCDIRTPVLILHSEEDVRCPIEQGEQLFVALKQLRREVRFVRFPGENHDLSRNGKPSHRQQRFQHILDWFDAHLRAAQ